MNPLTIISLLSSVAGILGQGQNAPPVDTITGLLKKLSDNGILKLPAEFADQTAFDGATATTIEKVTAWIPFLRSKSGLPAGGLDAELIAAIQKICLGSPTGVSMGGETTRARFDPATHGEVNLSDEMRAEIGDPGKWLRVFLEPSVVVSHDLIQRAFVAWQDVIGVRVRIVHDPAAANVIIKVVPLDGQGGKLAEATVGAGPGSPLVSTLCIDESEEWTDAKFLYAMSHEIGHLLGLEHIQSDDAMMAPVLQLDAGGQPRFTAPQPLDIATAKQSWGEPIA